MGPRLCSLMFLGLVEGLAFAQVPARIVATTNQLLPGGTLVAGEVYAPQIDDHGNVLFPANLVGFPAGLLYGNPADVDVIIKSEDPAPGCAGATMFGVGNIRLSPTTGKYAFAGTLQGPGATPSTDEASWIGSLSGPISLYYRENSSTPGGLCCSRPPNLVNDLGQTIFSVVNNGFITSQARVDISGNGVPIASGRDFPSLNGLGHAAMTTTDFHPIFGFRLPLSVQLYGGSGLNTVASVSDPIDPLVSQIAYFDGVTGAINGTGMPINNADQLAIAAERWFGDGTVRTFGELYKWSPQGGLVRLFRDGDAIPGGGTLDFGPYLDAVRINSNGQIVFQAATGPRPRNFGDPVPGSALFITDWDGTLRVIARANQPLPGLPTVLMSVVSDVFVNASGAVVFFASNGELVRGVPTAAGYTFDLIAKPGQVFEVAPGQFRSAQSVSITPGRSGGQDGHGSCINSAGEVAYQVSFQFFAGSAVLITDPAGPACDSVDFNNDGSLFDPTDIDAFLSVFSEGPCIPEGTICNDVDFNNDGSLFDPCDVDSFLLVFSEGPCTLCGE